MTAAEKAEQSVIGRPNSYVPGRTLLSLLGRHRADDDRPKVWNHEMHRGTRALLGALSVVLVEPRLQSGPGT